MKSVSAWMGDARLTIIQPSQPDLHPETALLGLQQDLRKSGVAWEHIVVDDSGLLVIRRQGQLATNRVSNRLLVGTHFKALTLQEPARWATDKALMALGTCSDPERLKYALRGKRAFTFTSAEATTLPHVYV
jgi:hypothetical protein